LIKSKTPAAMAISASKSPLWVKLSFRNRAVTTPNNISHPANIIMPKLFGDFVKEVHGHTVFSRASRGKMSRAARCNLG